MGQWHRECPSLPLVVSLTTVALAVVAGAKDMRYPDAIVHPRVECVEEGVFPNPRNCSWYYRCVDRLKIGFFVTFHYECAPGTVFQDEFDQCLFPYQVQPPCGTYVAPGQGTLPVSQTGMGASQPETGSSQPETATFQPGTGASQPGTATSQPVTATSQPVTATSQPVTGAHQPGTATSHPGTASSEPGTTSSVSCLFDDAVCKRYEVCEPRRETLHLCSGCYLGLTLYNASVVCIDKNQVIDRIRNKCVSPPAASRLCEDSSSPDTVVAETNQRSSSVICSNKDPRPLESWIQQGHCQDFALCDSGIIFKGIRKLCRQYFQCVRKQGGGWSIETKSCEEDQMFSYTVDGCVSRPSESELCVPGGIKTLRKALFTCSDDVTHPHGY